MSEADENQAELTLHARARRAETDELLGWLRADIDKPRMVLDAEAVEEISTPYVLALVAAVHQRVEAELPITVSKPSTAFVDAFSDLGLFQDLMKMEFIQ